MSGKTYGVTVSDCFYHLVILMQKRPYGFTVAQLSRDMYSVYSCANLDTINRPSLSTNLLIGALDRLSLK